MTVLGTVIQVENVDPHPHIDWAFGFSNTNREPIMSSDQSIVVPSKCNIDTLHVYTLTPFGFQLFFHFGHIWCTGFKDILEAIATTPLARKQYVRTSFNQFFGGAFCYSDGHLYKKKQYL